MSLSVFCLIETRGEASSVSLIQEDTSDLEDESNNNEVSSEDWDEKTDDIRYDGDFPKVPYPPRLVNDFAGLMDVESRQRLEAYLLAFNDTTSTQVYVITLSTLKGYEIADYAQQLFDRWGIGDAKKDNGVLILVKPKTESSKGRAFICTGYGVEGALPDIAASHIVNDEMIPYFMQEDYNRGIIAGAMAVVKAVEGEYTIENTDDETDGELVVELILFLLIIPLILGYASLSKRQRRMTFAAVIGLSLLYGYGQMIKIILSSGGGSRGSRGGGFSGGFSGGGGGHSGGGGGGGSW
jgi:uncharacterized protein